LNNGITKKEEGGTAKDRRSSCGPKIQATYRQITG
jgi:hypothetical protein